jgi:TRAP-type C4-dicarboxylate transport system permease small subunit
MKKLVFVLAAIAFCFAFTVLVRTTIEWAAAGVTGDEGIARAAAPVGTGVVLIVVLVVAWRIKARRDARRRQREETNAVTVE